MRELSSQGVSALVAFFILAFGCDYVFAENPVQSSALVDKFLDYQKITAISEQSGWEVGEILPVISKNSKLGVIGFLELNSIKKLSNNKFELRARLLRQSRRYFIQSGDVVRRMDLAEYNDEFIGSTDLIIKKSHANVSSRYRPLFYQGFAIGETAQTLFEEEYLINYLGNLSYGVKDWLTVGTFLTVNLFGRPNFNFKARVIDDEDKTVSTGLSFIKLTEEKETTINLNVYWDTISSDSQISHIFLSLGLIKWEGAADAAAIKALGSSSFQSGYEIIRDNWDRFLIGPNYNFEKKALGGFVSYIWIYDRFHAQLSINTTDVTKLKLDPTDGYYGFVDFFWRF
ncbi:MAG: hypothetical protein A2622_00785 [Bdellovibrionales bacterium RIFCSPHIGHO2_01_FULL_40_29]|nr:MAG: hypothetical protein A2622_00785 [Bdellovibrionales bacterium RIFCSPHIGHO2_01_FULL_40_29]OFZ32653.1 MAG: hypothetical protein A3D17_05385 [Bdellovibrionales bacterium RIFCSPHIGHO2_02_FULL_40_15]